MISTSGSRNREAPRITNIEIGTFGGNQDMMHEGTDIHQIIGSRTFKVLKSDTISFQRADTMQEVLGNLTRPHKSTIFTSFAKNNPISIGNIHPYEMLSTPSCDSGWIVELTGFD